MDKTDVKHGDCSRENTEGPRSPLCTKGPGKGKLCFFPWSSNPEPVGQGLCSRSPSKQKELCHLCEAPGSVSPLCIVHVYGELCWDTGKTSTWEVSEAKAGLHHHSCRLVGENLQHNRSCPTTILILAVQNKISDRRFLCSTICSTIRRPPCRKFSCGLQQPPVVPQQHLCKLTRTVLFRGCSANLVRDSFSPLISFRINLTFHNLVISTSLPVYERQIPLIKSLLLSRTKHFSVFNTCCSKE